MLFIICSAVFLSLFYLIYRNIEVFKLSWKLDGPFAWPLVGNALQFTDIKNVGTILDSYMKRYSRPIRVWLGPKLVVFITDAENTELVLKSKDCLNKPMLFYKILRDAIKYDSIFTVKEEIWRPQRRVVSSMLNESSIHPHLLTFNKIIRESMAILPSANGTFDALQYFPVCKVSVFMRATLGDSLDPITVEKYIRDFSRSIELVSKRFYQPLLYIDAIYRLTKTSKELSDLADIGRLIVSKILNQKADGIHSGDAFIDKLFEMSTFPVSVIESIVANIMMGASDTTATTSATLAVMLALHPDIQQRLFDEVLTIMPEKGTNITPESLSKLTFLDQCLNETLRIFPTNPMIARESSKPLVLKNGVTVPPGIPLIIGIRQIHMREEYWGPTAHLFDPTRFEGAAIKSLPSCSYIPFSSGARNCAGVNYAKIAVKCFVAHLVRNYHIGTPYKSLSDIKMLQGVSIRFVGGHLLQLKQRN